MAVLAGLGLILIALGVLVLGVGGIGIVGVGIGVVLVIHDWHLLYLCNGSMSRKNTPYSQKISKGYLKFSVVWGCGGKVLPEAAVLGFLSLKKNSVKKVFVCLFRPSS